MGRLSTKASDLSNGFDYQPGKGQSGGIGFTDSGSGLNFDDRSASDGRCRKPVGPFANIK